MLTIRCVRSTDLNSLMDLESSWPEGERATAAQLQSRIERFPRGFLVCTESNAPDVIIASATSCPITYESEHPELIASWNHATNDGLLPENSDVLLSDTLYLVSSVVKTSHRGRNVYRDLINELVRHARKLGYKRILTGAVMPGYDDYCTKHGETPASDYALMQRRGIPLDAFLRVLAGLGFHLPDSRHVVADYYPDEPSRCYAALLVCDLTK